MENRRRIRNKFETMLEAQRFVRGGFYRAVTCDGEIYDGRLTFISEGTVELQNGSEFRSFNRDYTKIVKSYNPDNA